MNYIPSPDGGPVYTETNFQNFFPEPYNTLTSFLFTLLSAFWFLKLLKDYRAHWFLFISNLILLIGSMGGTLYHGLRQYKIFLMMDYLPIMVLCFMAAFYFLFRSFRTKQLTILIILTYFLFLLGIHLLLSGEPKQYQISINYALLGLMVVGSTFIFLKRVQFREIVWVYRAIAFFALALLFRIADPWKWLPMGTHFLWHIFGMLATGSMFWFIYNTDRISLQDTLKNKTG